MTIKKLFLGGNTSKGFFSFYHYQAPVNAAKIYIIKGGSGVGKSNIMKTIGQAVAAKKVHVEFHYCSSDTSSLDGIYIPSIKVAMVDGTAPHIVDPKNPGAVEVILNLADYLDEEKIKENKAEIIATNKSLGQHFRRAYHYLAAAKIFQDTEKCYYVDEEALNIVGLNSMAKTIIKEALGDVINNTPAQARHLFASAITPSGLVNHLDTIFNDVETKILLNGDPGTGKSTIMKKLVEEAASRNISVEAYHCALNPDNIEHVLIPELKVGVITSINPHFHRSTSKDLIFDTAEYVLGDRLKDYHSDMALARDNYNMALEQGINFIKKAKILHDKLEKYYAPFMDFAKVNERKEEILNEILRMLG